MTHLSKADYAKIADDLRAAWGALPARLYAAFPESSGVVAVPHTRWFLQYNARRAEPLTFTQFDDKDATYRDVPLPVLVHATSALSDLLSELRRDLHLRTDGAVSATNAIAAILTCTADELRTKDPRAHVQR